MGFQSIPCSRPTPKRIRAAFQQHVTFGFRTARLMADSHQLCGGKPRASLMGTRVTRLADPPPKEVLVAYVKEAARLNGEGA